MRQTCVLSVRDGRGSLFLDPTRPDPHKLRPDPTWPTFWSRWVTRDPTQSFYAVPKSKNCNAIFNPLITNSISTAPLHSYDIWEKNSSIRPILPLRSASARNRPVSLAVDVRLHLLKSWSRMHEVALSVYWDSTAVETVWWSSFAY